MNFLKITNFKKSELQEILDLSDKIYKNPSKILDGKNIIFAFEKPSLRTKIGTEIAINKLGGNVLHVDSSSFFGGNRENIKDTVKNVNQWADGIFARVFSHETLEIISNFSNIPIINALCDKNHPIQALADLKTIQDTIGKQKTKITFIGDANNVAFSLMEIGLKFGYDVSFSGPKKYFWDDKTLKYFKNLAEQNNTQFLATTNPKEAVKNAKFVYADTFVSMGEEDIWDRKVSEFKNFQVNSKLMSFTDNAYFMHCLPAHRGIEVTDEIMDKKNSLIYPLAKNRMITSLGVFAYFLNQNK